MSESEPRGAAWRARMQSIAQQREWCAIQKGALIGDLLRGGKRLSIGDVMAVMGIRSLSGAYRAMRLIEAANGAIQRDENGYWYHSGEKEEPVSRLTF